MAAPRSHRAGLWPRGLYELGEQHRSRRDEVKDRNKLNIVRRLISTYCILLAGSLLCFDMRGGMSLSLFSAPLLLSLLAATTTYLHQRSGKAVCILVVETLLAIAVVDSFCRAHFDSPISTTICQLIVQTDRNEANEFLSHYVTLPNLKDARLIGLLALMVIYPILAILPIPRLDQLPRWHTLNTRWLLIMPILLLPEIPFIKACSHSDVRQVEQFLFQKQYQIQSTPWHRLIFSALTTARGAHQLQAIKTATLAATVEQCAHTSPHIVMVIGESANKYHSTLYGYTLPTTPRQQQRADAGELAIYTAAVSPWNITYNVLLSFFVQPTEEGDVYFPILFRRSGYHVQFASNQFTISNGGESKTGIFFLNDRELSDSLFDYRNRMMLMYDNDLVRRFFIDRSKVPIDAPTLDIIHLKGQHFQYNKRYPANEAFFQPTDKAYAHLGEAEREVAAHYDNATLYNDKVLNTIITQYADQDAVVIYMSDHGEEVYDDGVFQGRTYGEPTETNRKYQFEVPMWVWCSPIYKEKHPELTEWLCEMKDEPLMTDTVPRILMRLIH